MTVTFEDGQKITASKRVLNDISLAYSLTASQYERKGITILSKDFLDKSNKIYEELVKSGYYKD